jgi:thiol-disulfide isomerase/thioredoxin
LPSMALRALIAGGLLVSCTALGCSPTQSNVGATPAVKKESERRTVRLSDYRGKVVLLDFWATWCGPCKIEIPWFIEFERKYKDRGFAVIGISMDEEGWQVVKPFVSELGVNYRMVIGNDELADEYDGVQALPTTFLIDREGRIAEKHVGLASKSSFQNGIEELLQAPNPATGGRTSAGAE